MSSRDEEHYEVFRSIVHLKCWIQHFNDIQVLTIVASSVRRQGQLSGKTTPIVISMLCSRILGW